MPKMTKPAKPVSGVTLKRQLIFWLAALVIFVALFWLLSDVLLPFIVAMGLAYLLDPLVDRLRRLGISRTFAAIIILVFAIGLIALAFVLLIPALSSQLSAFAERMPGYIDKVEQLIKAQSHTWLGQLAAEKLPEAQKSLSGLAGQAAGWLASLLGSILAGGRALLSALSLIVLAPIIAFFLLLDWDRMVAKIDEWTPRPHRDTVRGLLTEMDGVIASFLRGQSLSCLILGTFYAVSLSIIGLNFGVLIGLLCGLLSFVPYVGAFTGFLLAGTVATAQFYPEWTWVIASLGVFVAGQAIEGNVLQPFLVGKAIGLHPVWLMFALIAFGYLFGFPGLLIAVPVAAAIGVLTRFMIRQYMASPYYTGE
ncbi:MAG TPA: AI-2E family transporter [Pseudorhodoplanes sp.]|nr:AI-2E family transporter [Pseudorhodoplanes sp.]